MLENIPEVMIGKQGDNYRITKELASGSFGSVYEAKCLGSKDKPVVAIKLLHTHLRSEEEQERFRDEARFLHKLKHSAILPLLDVGIHKGRLFFVVEYAANGTLRDRLRGQPFHIGEALTILAQIAQALQYAHDQNVVHRDLKPANILFNANGKALLADFGIAIILERTQLIKVEGSPSYMAPEQFLGKISKRSDQYALGCITYELLTGRQPFMAPNIYAIGYKHACEQPIPPTQLNPNIPGYMEQAILKAMAKKREDRYCDVSAFMIALQSTHTENIAIATNSARLICPKCGLQNRSGAKFCKRDGQPLIQDITVTPSQNLAVIAGKSPAEWLKEGDTLRYHEQYQEALEAYEQAIRLDPQFADAYHNKGITLNNLQRYQEALEAYDQAIRLNPQYAPVYHKSNTLRDPQRCEEALVAYEQAIRLNPKFAAAYYNKGITLSNLQRYEEALEAYDQAIRLNPQYALAYNNKGITLANMQRYQEALEAYDQAIRLNPQYALAYNGKGYTLHDLQRYEEALEAYEQAIRLDPQRADACNNKGNTLSNMQRYQEALEAFEQAIRLDPQRADACNNKGNTLSNMQRYQEALEAFEQAIRLNPQYAYAYYSKGNTLYNMQRYQEALKAFEQAIRLDPQHADTCNSKGLMLYNMQRYQEALKAFEQAIRLDPNMLILATIRALCSITCSATRRR